MIGSSLLCDVMAMEATSVVDLLSGKPNLMTALLENVTTDAERSQDASYYDHQQQQQQVTSIVILFVAFYRVLCAAFVITALAVYLLLRPGGTSTISLQSIPGPRAIPIIGTLVFLRSSWFQTLSDLRRKYGDIYRLKIGSLSVVVLCGRRAVEGALLGQSRVFAGRPGLHTFRLASEGKSMSFNGYSSQWTVHRRLADRVAKAMYSNKDFIESSLCAEAEKLCGVFLGHADQRTPFDPENDLLWSVAHVQYTLCYGNSRHDDSFHDMIVNTMKLIGCHNKGNLVDFFPWARRFLGGQRSALEKICDEMLSITKSKHVEHRKSFTRSRIRDILDALIEYGVHRKCGLDETQAILTVQEFIGAGLDIVHAALHWAILYLARYPEVQEKVREEILQIVGAHRTVTKGDIYRMPYTMAVISEVLRHSSVVPLALPHSTTKTTHLDGKVIPADTFILVNLHSVNHDEDFWDEPSVFQPERFLERTKDGAIRFNGDRRWNAMFGLGRRRCVGAELGQLEIFIYLTTILQSCAISLVPGTDSQRLQEPRLGIVLRPRPFPVIVKRLPVL